MQLFRYVLAVAHERVSLRAIRRPCRCEPVLCERQVGLVRNASFRRQALRGLFLTQRLLICCRGPSGSFLLFAIADTKFVNFTGAAKRLILGFK